jgi:hypothetical protein
MSRNEADEDVSVVFVFIASSMGIIISHFWDRPVPIFSDVRFSYLALVQDKKIMCGLPANVMSTAPRILHAFPF